MKEFEKLDNNQIDATEFDIPSGELERQRVRLSGVHFVLLGLGMLCLLFIAFISFSKSIEIRAVKRDLNVSGQYLPQAANINIDSLLKLPLGNRVLILPGSHRVRIQAEGFTDIEQLLEVGADRNQQFELELLRQPGKLAINLAVATPASVFVDGELFAELVTTGEDVKGLPHLVDNIPAGKHQITVDAPLYRSFSQNILILGKGETQTIDVSLQAAWAEYALSSIPQGATITVDGIDLGKTPLSVKIEEGTRNLVVTADKFKPFAQEIGVIAGENLVIPEIALVPADGIIQLASKPSGAAVILNSEYRGITPILLNVAPNTEQRVQIYKAGYRLSDTTESLLPEQQLAQDVELEADIIAVKVSVSPSDALVYVDGKSRGKGSRTLKLNTLPHNISVRKRGYVTQTNDIIPTRTNKQIISVNLLTEEQHYWSQVPSMYTSRDGHRMKLFRQLGEVNLGSSRREDGRRANEARYKATLSKPFYVALHETTNKQFRAFKSIHNSGNYKEKSLDAQKAPVSNVSWQQAARYCNWLSGQEGLDPFYQTTTGYVSGNNIDANGYRLLTEAEWSWLARTTDDGTLTYPWGNSKAIPTKKRVGNFADEKAADILAFTVENYDDGYKGPSPVGRYPANHRGLFDMGGNASEWVNDWYSSKGSSELGEQRLVDPVGPDEGEFHVVRGGSWAKGHLPQLRLAYREFAAKGKHDIGFRVARYAGLNKNKQSRKN
jgi:formylglycine-generating enzyme required for sulfatase activity